MIKQSLFGGKVEVGISEINDGNMRFFGGNEGEITENQKRLCGSINLSEAARIMTVYGERNVFTEYKEITKENLANYSVNNAETEILVSDGLVTRMPEVGLLLPLADCLGAVIFDEEHGVVGLLHAGRQNIEQDGPKKFIEYLRDNFGSKPEKLRIFCSPYALNYRIMALGGKSIQEAAMGQFASAGILPENIIDPKVDTVSDENFPSNSSGDSTKRFAIVVKMMVNKE